MGQALAYVAQLHRALDVLFDKKRIASSGENETSTDPNRKDSHMIKIRNRKRRLLILLLFGSILPAIAGEKIGKKTDGQQLFKQQCSLCHAIDKKKLGPAVNAMSREVQTLRKVITNGKNVMPAYAGKLTEDEITVLVDYLLTKQ